MSRLHALVPATLLAAAVCATALPAQAGPTIAFTLSERDLVPEGIAYDPRSRTFFVGSTNKRKIVRVERAGAGPISDFVPQGRDGLWGVVGLRVDTTRGILWALSSHAGAGMPMHDMDARDEGQSGLFAYDVATGRLLRRYLLPTTEGPHFLNDLVVDRGGVVYATDTRAGLVYRLDSLNGTLASFADPGGSRRPNGIDLAPGRRLYVALGSAIGVIDLVTGTRSLLQFPPEVRPATIDGLYAYENSLVAVQPGDSAGRAVVRYHLADDRRSIVRADVLVRQRAPVEQPTTGVVLGDTLYFVANSQLQRYRRLYEADRQTLRTDLDPTHIMKVALTPPPLVLVALSGRDSVVALDGLTLERVFAVATGRGPHEIVTTRDGRRAFVANTQRASVSTIDLEGRALGATYPLGEGADPHDVELAADERTLWATVAQLNTLVELDPETGTVRRRWTLPADGGWMVDAAGDNGPVVVAQLEGGGISVLDRRSGRVEFVPLAPGEIEATLSPDGATIWSSNFQTDSVTVTSVATRTRLAAFPSGGRSPVRVLVTPDGRTAIVANGGSHHVALFDTRTYRATLRIPLPQAPKVLAVSADGRRLYVSHPEPGGVSLVDLVHGKVVKTVLLSGAPDGVAVVR